MKRGFSLIEMMFVIAIIAVVTAYALPYYSHYQIRVRRMQAEAALQHLAVALEQYHITNNTYENASVGSLGMQEVIAEHHYLLTIASATEDSYFLQAFPLGEQANKDSQCSTLTLNNQGMKGAMHSGCW